MKSYADGLHAAPVSAALQTAPPRDTLRLALPLFSMLACVLVPLVLFGGFVVWSFGSVGLQVYLLALVVMAAELWFVTLPCLAIVLFVIHRLTIWRRGGRHSR